MRSPIVLAVLLTATSAFAQSLTEKVDVSLVNVDVTVTSHGAPARGLTRDDFQIFEDGVARPITNFYAVDAQLLAPSGTPPAAAQIADPADERFRRKVLVIVDDRHVSMARRNLALSALERFVNDRFTGGTYDWSIALISDKAHLMLPLTSDKERLHQAVDAIRQMKENPERPSVAQDVARVAAINDGEHDYYSGDWTRTNTGVPTRDTVETMVGLGKRIEMEADAVRTVFAIRDAIRSFAGAPGRKIILLITGGLGFDEGLSPLDANPRSFVSLPSDISRSSARVTVLRDVLIREANASDVSFYIVNSEGLMPGSDASNGEGRFGVASSIGRPMTGAANELSSMYWLARNTGGRLMPGNSAEHSLAEFDRASSTFYSLAYKPSHGDDGKYHTIKVRLNRPGYELQYRTGYSSVPVSAQLARAMQSPMAATMQQSSIPIDIVTGTSAPHDGGVLVPLQATVPAKNLQFIPIGDASVARIDLYVSLFDDRGRKITGDHFTREAHAANGTESAGNFVEKSQLLVKRGIPYRLVVAVHDQVTDAIGITAKTIRF
jgi:VWFA-related protein